MGTEVSKLYGGLHCQEGETRAVFDKQGKTNESVIMVKNKGDKIGNGHNESYGRHHVNGHLPECEKCFLHSCVRSPQQLGYKEGLVLIPVLKLRK